MEDNKVLDISRYEDSLRFIEKIRESADPKERAKLLYDNVYPLVWTSQGTYYPKGHRLFPSGGERTAHWGMGLVRGLRKPKILSFFTPKVDFFAHAIMDFETNRGGGRVLNEELGQWRDFGYNHFFFCLWTNEDWQTYPLRIYDGEKRVLFNGTYFHGKAENGNGYREMVSEDGDRLGEDISNWVIDETFERAIKRPQPTFGVKGKLALQNS